MSEKTIEQIRPDLFRVEIPLPRNPLKATNSYIIKSAQRNLIIDTGMNREECSSVMQKALAELSIDLKKTDIFVTHLHADHVGLVEELSTRDTLVYFNQPDADILNQKGLWEFVNLVASKHGFPAGQVEKAIDSHPGQRYSPVNPVDFKMVSDGDEIEYGDYKLQCIATPGHTGGHTCLYEPNLKYFFSGDHILNDITPNISTWQDDCNPLGDYFKSLDRVSTMSVDLVLPGHRRLINDCRIRIDQLKEHHAQRLEEVLDILKRKSPRSAFEVASLMTWDLTADSWDDFPLMQKWFATGEALAHICFLEAEGKVKRGMSGQTIVFYRKMIDKSSKK